MTKSRFIKGVWVGKLNNAGFVVYDKSINNLYEPEFDVNGKLDVNNSIAKAANAITGNKGSAARISLWVYETKKRQYFDTPQIKKELKENLGIPTDIDRHKVADAYLNWKYSTTGCTSEDEFNYKAELLRDELELIKIEYEDF